MRTVIPEYSAAPDTSLRICLENGDRFELYFKAGIMAVYPMDARHRVTTKDLYKGGVAEHTIDSRLDSIPCGRCGGELEYKCDMAQPPHHHVYGHKDECEMLTLCGNIEYIAQEKTNDAQP